MGLWLNAMLLRVKGQACCPDLCPLPPAPCPWVQQEGWEALAMQSLQSSHLSAQREPDGLGVL